jgi:hypothetical protein
LNSSSSTSGAAAQLAGIPRLEFLDRLHNCGFPTFQQSEQELLEDIENACRKWHCRLLRLN